MLTRNASASPRIYSELFAISFLVLFFELACIRWFGSHVVFLTFFTNVVLLASFLGMSVGCLAASRKTNFINWVPVLALLAVLSGIGILILYKVDTSIMVDVGTQSSPERVFFGTEYRHPDVSRVVIPMEVVLGFFFVLIALIFVGLGQVMGRRLDMVPNRVLAYTTNILGSIAGIAVFSVISFLWLSPFWWFLIGLGGVCFFQRGKTKRRIIRWVCAGLAIAAAGLSGWETGINLLDRFIATQTGREFRPREIRWSPYYRVIYSRSERGIYVNQIGHQGMTAVPPNGLAYALPYLLSQATERPAIRDILIIGAGSGNDTAAALLFDAQHVDAVEIDPVIYHIGKRDHPNKPYSNPRVRVYLNDGRNFVKRCGKKYDMIVYALVDSLILHSGYSSIRLESFLFTRQAFEDVKARLKEDGIFVMYNYFRQRWIVNRLVRLVQDVFGKEPLVIFLPYQSEVTESALGSGFTLIFAGDTGRLSNAFKTRGSYWISGKNFYAEHGARFGSNPQPDNDEMEEIGPAKIPDLEEAKDLPDDSWPFLYLRGRTLPDLSIRGMAVMGVLSLVILGLFAPRRAIKFNWMMFFLGAGFMLLETKSVVQLALLFGSTWIVNSVVFFAILVMILLSNLFVLKFRPEKLTFWYAALVVSLVVNIFVSLDVFLGLPESVKIALPCLIVFIPIFFAGVIFASYFRKSANPDMDFGSNIAGVVLGGLAENFSTVLGFNHLLWVAIGFYILSRIFKGRAAPAPA